MTTFELLRANESVLRLLNTNNVQLQDIERLEAYRQYKRLIAEGHKKEWIFYYLQEQYGVSKSTVLRLVERLETVVCFTP